MSLQSKAIVILIAGGHASGKKLASSMVESDLKSRFSDIKVKCIDMADYIRPTDTQSSLRNPSRFDVDSIKHEITVLEQDNYNVIIVHGLYALYYKELVAMGTVKVFIDCDADVRLGRWIKRDILDPGKKDETLKSQESAKLKSLLTKYLTCSRVEMNEFVFPTKEYADLILPRGAELTGTSLIVDGIQPLITLETETDRAIGSVDEDRSESSASIHSFTQGSASKIQNSLRNNISGPTLRSINDDNFSSKNKRFFDLN